MPANKMSQGPFFARRFYYPLGRPALFAIHFTYRRARKVRLRSLKLCFIKLIGTAEFYVTERSIHIEISVLKQCTTNELSIIETYITSKFCTFEYTVRAESRKFKICLDAEL